MGLTNKFARLFYRYSFDIVNNQEAHGWCFQHLRVNSPVTLRFFADDTLLGECEASQLRSDVQDLGVHPSGLCGFSFKFPFPLESENFHRLSVRAGPRGATLYRNQVAALPRVLSDVSTRVLFMHIPKTAGTSFNAFARKYFDQDRTIAHIEVNPPEAYAQYPEQYDYISGHLPIGKLKQHFDLDQFRFYTIIREPYAHVHSHFNWVRAIANEGMDGFARRHPQVVQELAEAMKHLDLSKAESLGQFIDGLPPWGLDFFDNIQTRYFLDHRPDKVTPAHLDEALGNLEAFTEIGLTERYQAFSKRFCRQLGVEYRAQPAALNRSKTPPLFDIREEAIRQVLLPLVETDLRLYQQVSTNS